MNERQTSITERSIDRWLKYAVIIAPTISAVVFGGVGYAKGFSDAKQSISVIAGDVLILKGWKEKQEDFNKVIIAQIATLQASRR